MRFLQRALVAGGLCLASVGGACGRAPAPPWEALPLGTSADFNDLWFADAQHGWIVGGSVEIPGGLVGQTADGGRTWQYHSNILAGIDRMSVLAVHFFDAQRGLIATDTGAILSTPDGGSTWAPVSRVGRGDAVSRLFFLDDRRGWAVGLGGMLRTDDGGERWTPVPDDAARGQFGGRAIQFLDDRNGWVAGMNASVFRTTDGGATWTAPAVPVPAGEHPSFWALSFISAQTGWIVGEEGTILATANGGLTWTMQSTGLKDAHSAPKLERIPRAGGVDVIDAGDRTPGLTLRAVHFVDREHGWVAGCYANFGRSLILRTDNGGATWAVEAEISGEELHALFIRDGHDLWAVGARVRDGAQAIYRRTSAAGAAK